MNASSWSRAHGERKEEMKYILIVMATLLLFAACNIGNERDRNDRMTCRANMRTIASQEVIYFAQNGHYASDLDDLGLGTIRCPAHGEYIITLDDEVSFTVACPGDHGNINNGIASWINADE